VFPSIPTICKSNGEIDEVGQRSVVRYCVEQGANGIACLLFAGEFYKFSDSERKRVARVVVDEVNGKIPTLVGVSHSGTIPSIELGNHARDVGADGIIAAPPYHSNFVSESQHSLERHYEQLARRVDLPIMIQDYETPGGVSLRAEEIELITSREKNVRYVKVEGKGQLERIARITHLIPGKVDVFGGMAGYHLLDEIPLGTKGSIPGAAMVGPLVKIFAEAEKGDEVHARQRFSRIKPYLDFFISHFDSFVSVEKEALMSRGVIRSSAVRSPAVPLSQSAKGELSRLLRRMGAEGEG
jgi:4-hydroxy-tetrahydrodipicolinate synthase